ncbi:anti-sigma regulatory factor [Amycolatopsis acidicola]|uniref:Anti-sigma regulatory factor n=1 Tax=Amycolatopsis acidicola TaxID=2596893 RepID=A0A5N0UKQ9_9PSEU|nr:anti-sigma regulatory factor [Amycolatopsis acidicola]KAA9149834.1 anti-sigma regulatory factor [Amycolatopsis acidicola]
MSRAGSTTTVVIQTETDIVQVRQAAREAAVSAGFSLVQQTKLVTAASELARNALVYGGGGKAEIEQSETPAASTVQLTFTDSGPGIPDIERALTDGYTTGSGLGLGLGGARRLADRFHIASSPGEGTVITLAISCRRKP